MTPKGLSDMANETRAQARLTQAADTLDTLTGHITDRASVNHLRGIHGWLIKTYEEDDPGALRAMHECAHQDDLTAARAELAEAEEKLSEAQAPRETGPVAWPPGNGDPAAARYMMPLEWPVIAGRHEGES
jgi:hypothetical protein